MTTPILDITKDHIEKLSDSDLRDLIGRLCEADYRDANLPTDGILWGGKQTSKDGGIDVEVRQKRDPPETSFIPKSFTRFQVRKCPMPRANILKEMCPGGDLRDSILELIQNKGAYIIVSSEQTTSTSLKNRLKAMQDSIQKAPNRKKLHVDFFDSNRVATWVRNHPALITWVRYKIGQPLSGWKPYGNWANPNDIDTPLFLPDEKSRFFDLRSNKTQEYSILDGLANLRQLLKNPRTNIRLVGLSGVGKTRFVQALFDGEIGQNALDSNSVVYSDLTSHPEPVPEEMANQIVESGRNTVLIVDNCPPDIHRKLAKICARANSKMSLLTVEYDIREDLPEDTGVFCLEHPSDDLIEKLIKARYPHIEKVNVGIITECSGGNARVALALASTISSGVDVGTLQDAELFERLFLQRNPSDKGLLYGAEACSLVYSFQGDDDSDGSELSFLGQLFEKTASQLYRDVAELESRRLVQRRGEWRAVLPHAIANFLARRALSEISFQKLFLYFGPTCSDRLRKSFTRRLSYLSDCHEAVQLTQTWLQPSGYIGSKSGLFNKYDISILENLAPVSPEMTLKVFEDVIIGPNSDWFISKRNGNRENVITILFKIAYDETLFQRCVDLMILFAKADGHFDPPTQGQRLLKTLFQPKLSGTHASASQKLNIIQILTSSSINEEWKIGMQLLDAAMQLKQYSMHNIFAFGTRKRDPGHQPNLTEIVSWLQTIINLCTDIACLQDPKSEIAKKLLADNFKKLWSYQNKDICDCLFQAATRISETANWSDGWLATQQMLRVSKDRVDDNLQKLHDIENILRPTSLMGQVHTFVLAKQESYYQLLNLPDIMESPGEAFKKIDDYNRHLGRQVANDEESFHQLLPLLVSSDVSGLSQFGMGLCDVTEARERIFSSLKYAFEQTPYAQRCIRTIRGFLISCSHHDFPLYNSILDTALYDDAFAEWFPLLQMTAPLDSAGITRLITSLKLGRAKVDLFKAITWGKIHESISDDDLSKIISELNNFQNAKEVIYSIYNMREYFRKGLNKHSDMYLETSRTILENTEFDHHLVEIDSQDEKIASLVDFSFSGSGATVSATLFTRKLALAISETKTFVFDHRATLCALAKVQPEILLESFLENHNFDPDARKSLVFDHFQLFTNPLNHISSDTLISWCMKEPTGRFGLAAEAINIFHPVEPDKIGSGLDNEPEGKPIKEKWNPVFLEILNLAPANDRIIQILDDSIQPRAWKGSRALLLEGRRELLADLLSHENPEISNWASGKIKSMQIEIDSARKWEAEQSDQMRWKPIESFE